MIRSLMELALWLVVGIGVNVTSIYFRPLEWKRFHSPILILVLGVIFWPFPAITMLFRGTIEKGDSLMDGVITMAVQHHELRVERLRLSAGPPPKDDNPQFQEEAMREVDAILDPLTEVHTILGGGMHG